jgi:peptide/nickel transport system substrate-binding protein
MAESWELSEDQMTVTLRIRSGLLWHDGTPVTLQDIVDNFAHIQLPDTSLQGKFVFDGAEITIEEPNTIRIQLAQPTPQIFTILFLCRMVKPGTEAEPNVIGSGPFRVESFEPPNELVLVRNEDYWQEGVPALDSLTVRVFTDPAAASLAFETGQIDILKPSLSDVQRLSEVGTAFPLPPSGNFVLAFNLRHPGPLQKKEVRQALSLAFDRERFAETTLQGLAQPTASIWPEGSPLFPMIDSEFTFDLAQAESLLASAGESGLEFEILTSSSVLPDWTDFLPIYQADLASIGVTMNIRDVELAVYREETSGDDRTFDVVADGYGFGSTDPAMLFITGPFRIATNASGFVDPEYESLIGEGLAGATTEERYETYLQIDEFVRDQVFVMVVAGRPNVFMLRDEKGISGFTTTKETSIPDYRAVQVEG